MCKKNYERGRRQHNPERVRAIAHRKYQRIKQDPARLAQKQETGRRNMAVARKRHPELVIAQRRKDYINGGKEKSMARNKENYAKLRAEVVAAYGGACTCCRETEAIFLAIDHVNNDGAWERRNNPEVRKCGPAFLYMIRREGFPDRYQLLCHNCNYAKSHGGCPHKRMQAVV